VGCILFETLAGQPPFGGPMMHGTQLTPGIITERNSALVVVLTLVTCGAYGLYWVFKTSDELKQATGDSTINPALDLLLSLVTCGLWSWYVQFRDAQIAHRFVSTRDASHKDQSQMILILNVATFVVGVTGLLAMFLTQEELNKLSRVSNGR
jgi:hypothetical protein